MKLLAVPLLYMVVQWLLLPAVNAAVATHAAVALHECVPQGIAARCGTLPVPENRARPAGRKIGLNIVVIPARVKPARADAFVYLSGGPGGAAATEMPSSALSIWPQVHERHDIVLVDQRGTGASHPLQCPSPIGSLEKDSDRQKYVQSCIEQLDADPSQYGTRAAMADLDAVRIALGYRTLDVYGTSYGATAAQMYLKLFPKSVRTLILDGATFVDVPFYSRYARNGRRALDELAARCSAAPLCARAFPTWQSELTALITKWNDHSVHVSRSSITGDGLAGVIQSMLLNAQDASEIPLVVSHAATGDYAPLSQFVGSSQLTSSLMFWSIMCNEPWVGIGSHGPWGTFLDGVTTAQLTLVRMVCAYVPKRREPASAWTRPHSAVPLLVLAGAADPQDPIGNLPGLAQSFPNSTVVIAPEQGHAVGQYGCLGRLVGSFVDRGTAKGLDTSCAASIKAPPFVLR